MTIIQEVDSLCPPSSFDRREFIRASIGCGFAVAAGPVLAQQAIRTDTTGLTAGVVQVPVERDFVAAYRAKPAIGQQHPTIVVVSEIFGVHEYIQDVCRRLAHQGYYAIAPDFFARQGDVRAHASVPELIQNVIAKVPDAQVLKDIDACLVWSATDGADIGRLGITGFCWGGRVVWLYAAHRPTIKAGVAWYGRLTSGFDPQLHPVNPVDVAHKLYAPVLGLYGGKDAGIPLETVERMKTALASGGNASKASKFVIYPEAPHAFHADYRPSYQKEAADDGWQRALAWFREYL